MPRYLLLFFIALSSCKSNIYPLNVNEFEYKKIDKCWKYGGQFTSYVILHKIEEKYFPYYISGWCNVTRSMSGSVIEFNLNSVAGLKFDSDLGLLKKMKLFDSNLESNTIDDAPLPKSADKVYIFSGNVIRLENDGFIYYRMTKATKFAETGLDLGGLMEMTQFNRARFFNDQR